MNTEIYLNNEWMKINYMKIEDMEGNELGEAEYYTAKWMDEIDVNSAKTEAATIWASDNGENVDNIYWE